MRDPKRAVILPALLFAGLLLQSCAAPPPPPGPALYSELRESLEGVDASALAGVKIVLDAGHGGRFAGAIGPSGIREADVNLGVALHLWGLLSDAGADVTLTRSSDRTVAAGDDASLRDDLLARAAIANGTGADVFISIHHNSDLSRDPTMNRIETYHKLSDPGPSLDAARAIHSRLSYNIGETRGATIPGNYLVLRTCEGPAILGEPSYISNPLIESRLREPDAQAIEAAAYFLGLVEYFSKGVPRLRAVEPVQGRVTGPMPIIRVFVDPGRKGGGIDPASVELKLDGEPRLISYDPADSMITCSPDEPMAAGDHEVSIRVVNAGGNWSPTLAFAFSVETEPARLILDVHREGDAIGAGAAGAPIAAGVPIAMEARVYDANMNPVADGTPVHFRCDGPAFPETSLVRSGKALCYILPGPQGSFEIEAACRGAAMGMAADPESRAAAEPGWWAFLRDREDGLPVAGATVSLGGRRLGRTNRDGFVSFAAPADTNGLWRIEAPGYEWRPGESPVLEEAPFSPSSPSPIRVLRLRRSAGGLLHGRVLAIDPEGGGDDRAGQGPSGTDASWVNYEVAAALARLIEASGGRAILTRGRGTGASDVQRLIAAETAEAFRYILISHRPASGGGAWIGHYPGSEAGKSLADAIAAAAGRLIPTDSPERPGGPPTIRENAGYALRQTSSPAVIVNLMPLNDRAAERCMSQPWNAAREAYAIYTGLLEHLAQDAKAGPGELSHGRLTFEIALPGGEPAAGISAALDGCLPLRADGQGKLTLTALSAGTHLLEVAPHGYEAILHEFTWPPEAGGSNVRVELVEAAAR